MLKGVMLSESDFALRLKSRSRSPESYPFMRIKAKRNKLTIEEVIDSDSLKLR